MLLPVNSLLKDVRSGKHWRLLDEVASRETKDNTTTHWVVIDVHDPQAMPQLLGKLKGLDRLGASELILVDDAVQPVNLSALSASDEKLVARRWRLVSFTRRLAPAIWDDRFRGRLARRLAAFGICSKPFFYEVHRLYWQRGQTKEALSTGLWRCGAPGSSRVAQVGAPKPGRPRTTQPGAGLAATEEHRQRMRIAWSRAPVGRDGRYLRKAWEWMLINLYSEHVQVAPRNADSHQVKVLHYDKVPTFEQFRYHFNTEHPFEVRQLKRMQQRRFDLAFKPLVSGTLPEVRGPGTRYYIDATVLDVYAVSRLNPRRLVGRPTLYVVIDQFSRMIVGIYVGLEPASWAGAMLALWNCSIDKVEFCRTYGIEITPDMWPTGYMPLHLMGDRGELKSSEADRLSAGFNLDVENARGYSGDAKGVVERSFRTLHTTFGPYLPGYIDKEVAGRDQEPAVLRSAMPIDAITRVVIDSVLVANSRVVRGYEGWPEVIADGTPFVPVRLWQWGVENLRADVRKYSDLHLKRYLWPTSQMKVTRRGLQLFRGLYYMGDALRRQSWFARALHTGTVVEVVQHPLISGSALAMPAEQNDGGCEVQLVRRSQKWGGVALSEIRALEDQSKQQNAAAAWDYLPSQLQSQGRTMEGAARHKRHAENMKPAGESKAERTRGVGQGRQDELAHMTAEAFLATTGDDPTGRIVDATPAPEADPTDEQVSSTADAVLRLFPPKQPTKSTT